ncbi:Fe(3+)-hydroxamate ABC transporter substrate-binding protein FhuD [Erwinia oleae]|uniref:Fe(3+)-hydroxamate ABC transporter substrate-binding protein FhuD n=1 Tax=Erwinia oleae TaxID=796334 RepID=UPI0005559585|nr:Fe(3+)-hydroxamate ABC transporter substrate-binding protein FhuD [Erwinia oleae]
MPDPVRRRLLMAMALSPLLPVLRSRAASPVDLSRIITIEWLPTELLMALGVAPMGAAEQHGYRNWVAEPALPASTVDVGLRTEPNLELMIQMKPSLILCSSGYGPDLSRIRQIAPTMGFSFSDESGKPLDVTRKSLLRLGEHLNLLPQAQAHLAQYDSFIAAAKVRMARRTKRPLLLISVLDSRHTMVFGKGSLFQNVMDDLGIESAWKGESSFWGSAVIGIERLIGMTGVDAICFDHGDDAVMQQVEAMPLWQAMPFVREKRFHRVPQVWFYGGTLSAMRFCRSLDSVLGTTA